jgi:hypothetical protein
MKDWQTLFVVIVVGFFALAWFIAKCTEQILSAIGELAGAVEAIKSKQEEMEN